MKPTPLEIYFNLSIQFRQKPVLVLRAATLIWEISEVLFVSETHRVVVGPLFKDLHDSQYLQGTEQISPWEPYLKDILLKICMN